MKNQPWDVNNVGHFAILLAHCSFFGDDVLPVSTLKEKGIIVPLTHKLEALMSTLHEQLPLTSKEEFGDVVQSKVEHALRDYLKPNGTISEKFSEFAL